MHDLFEYGTNPQAVCEGIANLKRPPLTVAERLQYNIEQSEAMLNSMKRAQEILKKNPEIEELLNILRNSGI